MAGQFAASCAFPWFPESAAWRETAAGTLRRELARQTFASGLNRELATEYHGFVLELGLAAALEGELAGHPLGAQVWDTLRRMTDALAAVVDVRLRPPRQGDGDDGHGLLLDGPGYDRWASLLATGAALFGPAPWWPAAPGGDARTALWTRLAARPLPAGARPARRPSLFPDAGMAILRDQRRSARRAVVPCRPRPARVPVDRRPRPRRRPRDRGPGGRGRRARRPGHLLLRRPSRSGGPGSAPRWPTTRWRSAASTSPWRPAPTCGPGRPGPSSSRPAGLDGGPVAEWRAAHHGYRRLRPPAVHHRSVRLDRRARRLVIEDRLDTGGAHDCRLAFHLGPDVACTLEGGRAVLEWPADHGRRSATLSPPRRAGLAVPGRPHRPAGRLVLAVLRRSRARGHAARERPGRSAARP